ncbi:anti-sigma factor family protein [Streptomyces sp. NPDC087897]|uniref:anti-sigma factor family protein n=1 Tax=Streptomyces sp. NPDC087897 TaxID=3365817 RepID=UPI00381DA095
MSGTGPTGPTPAEAHLGDRLAALVDGELKHDARERVLAHLATCAKCKAEADAQRRLKSAFAMSASPSPSEGFLARLQGLPGGPGGDGAGSGAPFGGRNPFAEEFFPALRPSGGSTRADSPLDGFGYVPAAHGAGAVLPGRPVSGSVFRIHEVARDADRSAWRGRRFAFAAAGAVSLAAIALGGSLPLDSGPEPSLRAEGTGNNVSPLDAETRAENGAKAVSRRGGGALAPAGGVEPFRTGRPSGTAPAGTDSVPPALTGKAPAAPAATPPVNRQVPPAAPLLFGGPASGGHPFVLPVLNVSVPPLVRPAASGAPLTALGSGTKPKTASSASLPRVPANDLASPLSPRP